MRASRAYRLESFTGAHAAAAIDLFAKEDWGTYTCDPTRTIRALSAPGCTTLLAVNRAVVVGLVQLQSDGEIQTHLSALLVAAPWRRSGLGRGLLHEALKRAGGIHVDVLTRNPGFYESLGGEARPGFRLTHEQLNPHARPHQRSDQ